MILKIIIILLSMFLAFAFVYGIGAMIYLLMSDGHKRICQNCSHYDPQMDCCYWKFQKVEPRDRCNGFERERDE